MSDKIIFFSQPHLYLVGFSKTASLSRTVNNVNVKILAFVQPKSYTKITHKVQLSCFSERLDLFQDGRTKILK